MLVRSLGFILIVIGNQWREQQNPHTVKGAEWVDKEKQLAQCLHFYPTFMYWIGQNVHSDFSTTSNRKTWTNVFDQPNVYFIITTL